MCWEIVSAIGSLLSGLGIIVAIVAYLLSKKKFEVDIDFKRKENAIQIAERYTSMINSITFITVLYQEFRKKTANINFGTAPVRKYIETHKVEQLLFNKKEYDQIYGKDKDIFSEILDIVDKDKTLFLEIYTMFHDDDAAVIKKLTDNIAKIGDKTSEEYFEFSRIWSKFQCIPMDTLNEIEAICMSFNCKIADEMIVFKSLHQTLLDLILLMFPVIAIRNKSSARKYFTHTIELYNRWNGMYKENFRLEQSIEKEKEEQKKNIEKSASEKATKLEHELTKTPKIKQK